MKALAGVAAVAVCACLESCKSSAPEQHTMYKQQPVIGSEVMAMPRAVVYRVSGECADLVPVAVSADGTSLLSYPAPTDLSDSQKPVQLKDGWWLDRRGIGPQTRFTTYTYAQYMAMKQAPSPAEILAHLDSQARITRMVELPLEATRAAADPKLTLPFIADGFKGCVELVGPAK